MKKLNISFEGASGIGKTTLCERFKNTYSVIPEVNLLFKRSGKEDRYWYLEKQVERFDLGNKASQTAIFDGDIFQPLWYNWIYHYPAHFLSEIEIHSFYEHKIKSGEILFPDLYIIFHIHEAILRERKEGDKKRQRRNFEKHLEFIKPQIKYFQFLKEFTRINVEFVEFLDLKTTFEQVDSIIRKTDVSKKNDILEYQIIQSWIKNNTP